MYIVKKVFHIHHIHRIIVPVEAEGGGAGGGVEGQTVGAAAPPRRPVSRVLLFSPGKRHTEPGEPRKGTRKKRKKEKEEERPYKH